MIRVAQGHETADVSSTSSVLQQEVSDFVSQYLKNYDPSMWHCVHPWAIPRKIIDKTVPQSKVRACLQDSPLSEKSVRTWGMGKNRTIIPSTNTKGVEELVKLEVTRQVLCRVVNSLQVNPTLQMIKDAGNALNLDSSLVKSLVNEFQRLQIAFNVHNPCHVLHDILLKVVDANTSIAGLDFALLKSVLLRSVCVELGLQETDKHLPFVMSCIWQDAQLWSIIAKKQVQSHIIECLSKNDEFMGGDLKVFAGQKSFYLSDRKILEYKACISGFDQYLNEALDTHIDLGKAVIKFYTNCDQKKWSTSQWCLFAFLCLTVIGAVVMWFLCKGQSVIDEEMHEASRKSTSGASTLNEAVAQSLADRFILAHSKFKAHKEQIQSLFKRELDGRRHITAEKKRHENCDCNLSQIW